MKAKSKPRKINILGIIRLEGEMTLKEVLWIMAVAMVFIIILALLFSKQQLSGAAVYSAIKKIGNFFHISRLRGP